ncbi:MAG: ATP-binding cassette domain-containing protein [Clostridia bacterium]|nr:ATP-binding cassette domain-containing protein [Clostridia bacterium]
MLELKNVTKIYGEGAQSKVTALSNVTLSFRKTEFVSVLGPSGCGKSTMLNIIGGLDRYTEGEMIVDGVETSDFSERDWDTYRNRKIGFVFQSYNLITHQTVLENVELALTLSGVDAHTRKRLAMKAIDKVGLANHLHKKPNELSGGEMQRVAIARALVNNPEVILADEPTGALDSKTSILIMDLLKEIAKDRLVIMVTHNDTLAQTYSTRIIKLKDGKVVIDSNPFDQNKEKMVAPSSAETSRNKVKEKNKKKVIEQAESKKKHTSMSFWLALSLSLKNLMTKKSRTFLTSIASSIGIVGLALVLALFNGLNLFLDKIQGETLSAYPMYVSTSQTTDITEYISILTEDVNLGVDTNLEKNKVFVSHLISKLNTAKIRNKITPEFQEYMDKMPKEYGKVSYSYGTSLTFYKKYVSYDVSNIPEIENIIIQVDGKEERAKAIELEYVKIPSDANRFFKEMIMDDKLIQSQYDVYGKFPTAKNEICLVLDKNSQISDVMLTALLMDINASRKDEEGNFIRNEYTYDQILNTAKLNTFNVALNNGYYVYNQSEGVYKRQEWTAAEMLSSKYKGFSAEWFKTQFSKAGISVPNCYSGGQSANEILELKITAILRLKDGVTAGALGTSTIGYTTQLTEYLRANANNSNVVKAQRAQLDGNANTPCVNVLTGKEVKETDVESLIKSLGYAETPTKIEFYANSFANKQKIKEYVAAFNALETTTEETEITIVDVVKAIVDVLEIFVDVITYILLALTAISLIVAAIMIAIITYVSVIERTKEIGILRSIGARKIDVMSVFNAETVIIGLFSGVIGVLLAIIIQFPLNAILYNYTGVASLVVLSPLHALLLVGISILVTLLSGMIPAFMASKKDPVKALRSE